MKVQSLRRTILAAAVVLMLSVNSNVGVYAASESGHEGHIMPKSTQSEGHTMDMNHSMDTGAQQSTMNSQSEPQASGATQSHEGAQGDSGHSEHGSHGGNSDKTENPGPDWPVLYGFGAINLLVITGAAIMKFIRKEVR